MKSNSLKYIFITFAIIIMIFAIVKIKNDEQNLEEQIYRPEEEKEEIITELNLGVASFDSINPILSKNKNIQDISKIIFEPLMTLTSDYKLENCLVKEWAKQNETTYIIKLRDDKKWSDGQKFTSEDVKFTIDRLKDSETIYSSNIQQVSNVEIVDETTLRIILFKEVPCFEYNLTFPILSQKFYSDKDFIADIVPIGTGMYKVTEVQGSKLILRKNDYYQQKDEFKLDKITITIYSSVGELYNSFKTGNIDFVSTQNSNIKEYIGTIGYISKEMKGREHDFLAFNTQNNILSDVNIRKAIGYSVDKSNIVSSIFSDNYYVSNFPLDYGNWVYQDIKLEENIDRYMLQGVYLNFVVKASDTLRVNVAENIKNQLQNLGMRINLIKATDEQYQNYIINKNYDMILCSINLSVSPDLSSFFGENNLANYSNEEVSNIMNEIKNLNNEEKLKNNYKRLEEIYITEMPYLSLYNNKYTVAYNQNLVGTADPNWFYQFYNIKDWHK